jgi:DNA-directed RNA polymerase subunit E'/Rpb7
MVVIKEKIGIEPKYFNGDIESHIYEKLKKTRKGTCTMNNGYILDIVKLIKIGENIITSANSWVIFEVFYEAITLKPYKGLVLSGEICMVFSQGVFVDIQGKMQILIPDYSLISHNFKYDESKGIFSNSSTILTKGGEVNVEITMVKYEKRKFGCIGKLKI